MIRKQFLSLSLMAAMSIGMAHTAAAQAQATGAPPSTLQNVLSRMDFGLVGTGDFTKSVNGTNYQNTAVTQDASNTFGGLFTVRYTKSPWLGFEANIGYQRFTQTYSCCGLQGGLQANAQEYTFGYVVHPVTTIFGAKPFASVGSGVMEFKPTPMGGQGLRPQARQTYYYSAGADIPAFADFFAIRLGFRQQFYLAPDFGQNYLTIKKHTITSQPEIGFIFHF